MTSQRETTHRRTHSDVGTYLARCSDSTTCCLLLSDDSYSAPLETTQQNNASSLDADTSSLVAHTSSLATKQQAAAADNAAELFCDQLYNYSHNLNGTKLKPQMTITSLSKILNAMSHPLLPPSTSSPPPHRPKSPTREKC